MTTYNPLNEGYMFCCFGKETYFKLANRLVNSIRKFDNTRHICILTDDIKKLSEHLSDSTNCVFMHFHLDPFIHPNINITNEWHKFGFYPKIFQSFYSPFEHTMSFDCDVVFHKDFTFLWNKYYNSNMDFIIPGLSDEYNKSPSNWHWNTIDQIINNIGINIPQTLSSLMIYNKKLSGMIHKNIGAIFNNIEKWGCKPFFNDGYPDEIVYSIICGAENIKPNEELFKLWCTLDVVDSCNKDIE
jgi:hypothetical protein